MSNPIGWFEIYVDDMARAKQFYESVLQVNLELLEDPTDGNIQMYSFPCEMDKYGATGALVKMDVCPAGGNSTVVYFSCEDCSIEEARVNGAGGKVERSKMSIGEYGFISLVLDTEGNMIGLHSLK